MLLRRDRSVFAANACTYQDHHPSDPPGAARIVIPVEVAGLTMLATVDTGGVYVICDPEIVSAFPEEFELVEPANPLLWRGETLAGNLYRLRLRLVATQGADLEIEATAFVPEIAEDMRWQAPLMLGLTGCLERLRFAVDPTTNTFYFDAI